MWIKHLSEGLHRRFDWLESILYKLQTFVNSEFAGGFGEFQSILMFFLDRNERTTGQFMHCRDTRVYYWLSPEPFACKHLLMK